MLKHFDHLEHGDKIVHGCQEARIDKTREPPSPAQIKNRWPEVPLKEIEDRWFWAIGNPAAAGPWHWPERYGELVQVLEEGSRQCVER